MKIGNCFRDASFSRHAQSSRNARWQFWAEPPPAVRAFIGALPLLHRNLGFFRHELAAGLFLQTSQSSNGEICVCARKPCGGFYCVKSFSTLLLCLQLFSNSIKTAPHEFSAWKSSKKPLVTGTEYLYSQTRSGRTGFEFFFRKHQLSCSTM